MKAVVSILLTLVLAAGPWLCCCTAGHIARTEPVPASTPHKASCCASQAQTNDTPDDTPLAPTRSCSCQAESQPATLAGFDSPLPESPLVGLVPMDCSSAGSELALSVSPINNSLPSCFLESRDILRLFHILRC